MSWVIYGATAIGNHHIKEGRPCADFVGINTSSPTKLALVVDGAGSIRGSSLFAKKVCETLLDYFKRHKPSVTHEKNINEYLKRLYQHLHTESDLMSLAGDATLVVLLITPYQLGLLQVGDGVCVVQKRGHLKLLSPPSIADFPNETDLIKDTKTPFIATLANEEIDFFALSSDGLSPVAIDTASYTPHRPFFAPFINFLSQHPTESDALKELNEFLKSPRLQNKVKDDVSLVIGGLQ